MLGTIPVVAEESYTSVHEFGSDVYQSGADALTADGYTDYAVVTFSRSGAEGASPSMDYDGDGSTIVLINSATAMELGFVDSEEYNVDACLWIGHSGEAGIIGVGTILTGRTNPSGRKDAHQWGEEGSENAPSASETVSLETSIVYDESGDVAEAEYAGARAFDEVVAKNAMDDVTAGDGNMVDGYLSRNDIAGGMTQIMENQSNEEANETLDEDIAACLALTGTDSYEYTFETFGIGEAYAPAMNTHRSPFGGRNFEYYSEDGFIAGQIGGSAVAGIQSTGTSVFVKHCALNDGDTNRGGNTTWANEQAIREIYMLPYEISCKEYNEMALWAL